MESLARHAIVSALKRDWDSAVEANLALIAKNPADSASLVRLAHAYFELGNLTDAKKYALLAKNYDPSNPLAEKCIARCKAGKITQKNGTNGLNSLSVFFEEPGRTKTVSLKHVGDPHILLSLSPGDMLLLKLKKRQVTVESVNGTYVGKLPDDTALWVIKNAQKLPQAAVQCTMAQSAKIIVRLNGH